MAPNNNYKDHKPVNTKHKRKDWCKHNPENQLNLDCQDCYDVKPHKERE